MYESQLSFWGGNTFHAHPILKIGAYSLLSCWSWELGHKRLACQVEKLGFSWRKQGACGSSDTQQTIWEFDVKDDQILTNFNGLDQLRGHWVSIWNEGKDQKDSDSLWSHTFFFLSPLEKLSCQPRIPHTKLFTPCCHTAVHPEDEVVLSLRGEILIRIPD